MNIYKKCLICGKPIKLSKQGGDYVLYKHIKEAHPEEFQTMMELDKQYHNKLDELDVTYEGRNSICWFESSTKEEWKKTQPVTKRPMYVLLDLMRAGWEVGTHEGWRSSYTTAQKNGLGKGGEAKHYSISVIKALERRGLIKRIEAKFPLQAKYVLTISGRGEGNGTSK